MARGVESSFTPGPKNLEENTTLPTTPFLTRILSSLVHNRMVTSDSFETAYIPWDEKRGCQAKLVKL